MTRRFLIGTVLFGAACGSGPKKRVVAFGTSESTIPPMRALAHFLLLMASVACSHSSDYSTPCPSDKQFCQTPSDGGGCYVEQLICCEGSVPPCAGSYSATLPATCTSLPTEDCL